MVSHMKVIKGAAALLALSSSGLSPLVQFTIFLLFSACSPSVNSTDAMKMEQLGTPGFVEPETIEQLSARRALSGSKQSSNPEEQGEGHGAAFPDSPIKTRRLPFGKDGILEDMMYYRT